MTEQQRLKQRQTLRLGIAIPLTELRQAMDDYLRERGGNDDLLPRLLLSDFLEYLRKKQQKADDDEINQRR